MLVRQLAFRQRSLGAEHPGTLRTMDLLAETLQSLGNHRHARVLRRDALTARQHVYGAEAVETARSALQLVHVLRELDDTAELRDVLERELGWLVERDPGTLEAELVAIRAWVERITFGLG